MKPTVQDKDCNLRQKDAVSANRTRLICVHLTSEHMDRISAAYHLCRCRRVSESMNRDTCRTSPTPAAGRALRHICPFLQPHLSAADTDAHNTARFGFQSNQ